VRLVLSYSRKGYSEAATRQDTETFLRRLDGLRSFGGSPLFPTKPAGAAQARKSQGVTGTESPDSFNNTLKAENRVSALSAEVHRTCCCLLEIISRTYALSRCSGFLLGAIRQYRRWDPYGAEANRKLYPEKPSPLSLALTSDIWVLSRLIFSPSHCSVFSVTKLASFEVIFLHRRTKSSAYIISSTFAQ
jgi:hypothetical protein